MNKKGFTLVELLGTIVIIALVIGGITFGVISIIKETKKQGSGISTSSIEKTASIYAEEKIMMKIIGIELITEKDMKENTFV